MKILDSILKILFYMAVFILSIYIFIPKDKLYFAIENQLSKQNIYLNEQKTSTTLMRFNAKNVDLIYAKSSVAKVKSLQINGLKLTIKDIKLQGQLAKMLPSHISQITIDPLTLNFYAKGDFGVSTASIDIFEKKIKIYLKASKLMSSKYKNILKQFKSENGRHVYEFSF